MKEIPTPREFIDAIRDTYDQAAAAERQAHPSFVRWPDLVDAIDYVEAHGIGPCDGAKLRKKGHSWTVGQPRMRSKQIKLARKDGKQITSSLAPEDIEAVEMESRNIATIPKDTIETIMMAMIDCGYALCEVRDGS